MRISIVLCTYNGESFLREQLDSLLAQTRRPDEIVIADDASTDATWSLLEEFAHEARSAGITVDLQRNPVNSGYVANFTTAMMRANGDLVFLCDQDDIWHWDKLRRMSEEFRHRPELGLLHADARLVDREGRDLGLSLFQALEVTSAEISAEHAGDAFDVLLRRNVVTGATLAVRRHLLVTLLPIPEDWVHDEWLAMAACMQMQVDCLEWQSINYRQHGNNQIGMRRRTLRDKLFGANPARHREKPSGGDLPKREFMQLVAQRLTHALDRLGGHALLPSKEARIRERIAHAQFRANLSKSSWARWPAVIREARSGRYTRYSSGMRSILSDLVDLK